MKTAKGLVGLGLLLGTFGVLIEPAAAAPSLQFPSVVFGPKSPTTAASIPVFFNGDPDLITSEPHLIVIDTGGADGACPGSFTYDGNPEGGCTELQLSVTTGTLSVDANGFEVDGGAEVLQNNGDGGQINIIGSDIQVNAALLTLRYEPPLANPNDSNDPFETFDTAGGRVFLTMSPQDGDDVQGPTEELEIRIEGINDPPTLAVGTPSVPLPYSVTPDGDANTTELETNDLVVLEDVDLEQGELDDFILVVAWVTEGRFTLRNDNGCVGTPDEIFTAGFCLDSDFDNLLAELGPVGDLVPAEVLSEAIGFAPDFTTPSQAVAFVAEHDPAVNILTRLEYYADENDCDCSFNVFATDLGNNGMPLPGPVPFAMPSIPLVLSIPIEVRNLVNDAPTVEPSLASPVVIDELATSAPFDVVVEDVDAECDITLDSISATGGVLTGAPATPASGTPEVLSGLLTGLTFTASETTLDPGLGSVVVNVQDNGCGDAPGDPSLTGQGTLTFTIDEDGEIDTDADPANNDPPAVAVPASPIATTEGVLTEFVDGDIDVSDPDAGPAGELTMTIGFTGDGTMARGVDVLPNPFVETGTLAELNLTLDALRFTPTDDPDGADTSVTIEIEVDDNGNTGAGGPLADADTFTLEVADPDPDIFNVPPSITVPAPGVVTEGDVHAFGDFTVTDPDVGGGAVMGLTIGVDPAFGTLNSTGGNGLTLAEVNQILDDLTLDTPEDDADFADEAVTVTITVDDNGNTGTPADPPVTTDTADALLTITDDDDPPPDLNGPPALAYTGPSPIVLVESTPFAFTGAGAVTLTDDADPADQLQLTITEVGDGSVAAAAVPGDTFGTLAELQAVLAGLVYTAGVPGAGSITITVNDLGSTGTGGPQTASLTIPVAVIAAGGGATTTTSTTTSTTLGGAGGTTTSTTAAVGAGGAGRGGSTLPRTGADLLVLAGVAFVLTGVGGLLSGRRARTPA